MITPIPVITKINHRGDERLIRRFNSAIHSLIPESGMREGVKYSSNTVFQWRLPHGSRQCGQTHGLKVIMPQNHAPEDPLFVLSTLQDAAKNRRNTDLYETAMARLKDFYIAAAVATGDMDHMVRVSAPTPFISGKTRITNFASKDLPIIAPINPDLPVPCFVWMGIDILQDKGNKWLNVTPFTPYQTYVFEDIDPLDAITAAANLSLPYPENQRSKAA